MPDPSYSKDETQVLKQRRLFQDLIQTDGWKELMVIVERQITDNFNLLVTPLHKLENPKGLSFEAFAAQMESVKGSVNGMRYVMSLPQNTIDQGSGIIREHNPDGETTS